MALKVIVGKDKKDSGVLIPLEDWDQLNTTVKPHTPIYNLMEELTVPAAIRPVKEGYMLPSGLTIQEAEQVSRNNVEDIYIKAFAKELPRYYEDERCTGEKNMIRANPDGSEDLVDFNWQDGTETFIQHLVPPGKGKFAYLLHDARYQQLKDTL
jgi:hypothetical protein